ncbi:putative glycosidase C21B10.07 [Daldinia childiae]|uniref:putative glycosidase C21B10.07 n=1 Tax=Daldinia childiae TaxID=326645 RepID=UPI0014467F9D|nr:putative glycosidase C21B10.07 [Daldinia childiae]KAF3064058.1 putative glycosidase C21B10.07 [Daldinia childiae]
MGWENTPAQPKAGPTSFNVRDTDGPVEMVTGPPPYYSTEPQDYPRRNMRSQPALPWWNPKSWRKRTWAIVVIAFIIIIIVAVVTPVEVAKANRYPNYTKLNYALADEYSGTTFFDKFNYFVGYDPAQGFVHYVPEAQATQLNLTYASEDSAIIRVDTSVGPQSEPDASTGRFSVRIESQAQYDNGLFIFDVKHTPFGCGTWPALWLVDPANWPDHGEIDVMEAANKATDGNQMTLHTTDGCSMDVKRIMSDSGLSNDCHNATDNNAGCGVRGDAATYGSAYNDGQGGIIAMEWRNEDFPNTNCDIGSHFKNQSIIANIDLCGQYAGALYASSGCPSNCTDYVANNPEAFTDAFWEFGKFEVYKAT